MRSGCHIPSSLEQRVPYPIVWPSNSTTMEVLQAWASCSRTLGKMDIDNMPPLQLTWTSSWEMILLEHPGQPSSLPLLSNISTSLNEVLALGSSSTIWNWLLSCWLNLVWTNSYNLDWANSFNLVWANSFKLSLGC